MMKKIHPTTQHVTTLLQEKSFDELERSFTQWIDEYRRNPDSAARETLQKAFIALGEADKMTLEEWLQKAPDHTLVQGAVGLWHATKAQQIRGYDRADTVSEDEWRLIQKHFNETEHYLKPLLDQNFPAGVFIEALISKEQICGSRTQAEKYFDVLVARDTHWLSGWLRILGIRDPRWSGSFADMQDLLDLARKKLSEKDTQELTAVYFWRCGTYAYHFEDDCKKALSHYEQALNHATRSELIAEVHENRAYAFQMLEDHQAQVDALRLAVEHDPSAQYDYRLALALIEARQWEEAIALLEKTARLNVFDEFSPPLSCALWLGSIFFDDEDAAAAGLTDHPRAITWLERAVALAPKGCENLGIATNRLGLLYQNSETERDLDKAEHYFRMAIECNNEYAPWNLAQLLKEQNCDSDEITAMFRHAALLGHDAAREEAIKLSSGKTDPETMLWLEEMVDRGNKDVVSVFAASLLTSGRREAAEILLWQFSAGEENSDIAYILGRALLDGYFGKPEPACVSEFMNALLPHAPLYYETAFDFMLTYAVATYQKERLNSWKGCNTARGIFEDLKKMMRETPKITNRERKREFKKLRRKIPSFYFSWRLRKMLGMVPEMKRMSPFHELDQESVPQ